MWCQLLLCHLCVLGNQMTAKIGCIALLDTGFISLGPKLILVSLLSLQVHTST